MDTQSFYTRHMLLQYGRQLISSRKLARYHQILGKSAKSLDVPPPDVQRQLMVERIAREVVDNLIFSGSDNPVVHEVKERLDQEMGASFVFQYPPGEIDFKIFRDENGKQVEVTADEKHIVMGRLLDITRQTVAETML